MQTQIDYGYLLFITLLFLFGCVCFSYLLILIAHVLMPKHLIKDYFKSPYFQKWELNKLSIFPFFFIRTVMFMRLLAQPSSGKKRGLTEVYQSVSPWFRKYCAVVLVFFLASFLPGVTLLFGSALYLYITR